MMSRAEKRISQIFKTARRDVDNLVSADAPADPARPVLHNFFPP
jgi:hypothetical protein